MRHVMVCGLCCMLSCCALCTACRVDSMLCHKSCCMRYAARCEATVGKSIGVVPIASQWRTCLAVGLSPTYAAWSMHLLTVRCATGTGPYGPLCRYLAHRLGGRTRDQHAAPTVVGRCTAHIGIVSLVPTAIPSSHAKAERRHVPFKGERKRSARAKH